MTFAQSIRTCIVDKIFDYSGRASRSEYWWFALLQIIVIGIIPMVLYLTVPETFHDFEGNPTEAENLFYQIQNIAFYALAVPLISVSVRRFHDLGLSGWWFIAVFAFSIPIEFDPINDVYIYLSMLSALAQALICIYKGTDGPNRFGQDPLKPDHVSVFE